MADALRPEVSAIAANAIRALAIDAVNAANSGHPGAPMGLADIATVLFAEVMRYDPSAPNWPDRDRFVLSNGHGSMLQYAVLHLAGYDLPMEDIRRFRQMGSKTPGHPEFGLTPGVETTTGPLGQGFANAVGMALGRKMAAARCPSDDGFSPLSHRIYCVVGDGCLMEGISSEAASLAGHLGLGDLICFYDDNGISIDGNVNVSFSENIEARFSAHGWHVLRIDGHNPTEIRQAIKVATEEAERPSLIIAKTRIGFGSPNREGTAKAHGEALGEEEARLTKEKLGWNYAPFEVPDAAYGAFRPAIELGKAARAEWQKKLDSWCAKNSANKTAWQAHFEGDLKLDIETLVKRLASEKGSTRNLSGLALNAIVEQTPRLIGGSADLTGSNKTKIKDTTSVSRADFSGRYIHFGVREHAMAAMVNGLALYGGFVPFGATFLTFSDYMRNSVRLSALMKVRAIQIFTHDSIGLGEDGPTHQPIEHLWSLRLIPELHVWRPADGLETAMTWAYAVSQGEPRPHAMVYSRQSSMSLPRPDGFDPRTVWKGGYVVRGAAQEQVALVATGTEVGLAIETADMLATQGIGARVVSMPCVERFLAQDSAYRKEVLPDGLLGAAIEAGSTTGWYSVIGGNGLAFGVDTFGESAPAEELYAHFGLTPAAIAKKITTALGKA
ncbi:MAG: transketolase [Myxococcales bacterium]|nr:transketolase [Myxococcales bacterium]